MNDLWEYLAGCNRTIIMYGMGNGADKILRVCAERGIEISDFFASDGFVRNHCFHGKRVMSYGEVCEKYNDFIVLLSFASSLPDVIANIIRIASEHELYVPDVPVSGVDCFDREYYNIHYNEISRARELFADEHSRQIYDDIIAYKLSGNLELLMRAVSRNRNVFAFERYKYCIDCGAYNGDTARQLIDSCPQLERVLSIEPDRRNYKKLSSFAMSEPRVVALNCGVWNREDILAFNSQGNRNSSVSQTGELVRMSSIDILTSEYGFDSVDYIKYDVEGAEREALLGSTETIHRCKPELLVSAYHRNEDIFALPALVHKLLPEYKLYLRRETYIPAWELQLCAVI